MGEVSGRKGQNRKFIKLVVRCENYNFVSVPRFGFLNGIDYSLYVCVFIEDLKVVWPVLYSGRSADEQLVEFNLNEIIIGHLQMDWIKFLGF
ncbi:hypothetical protein ACJIZ3_004860 [Penstemon smallii]|uniref:Uncharacterized protein n=1 Tax=Penstemon smallii TaxID=265156 RepID=A0ABD3S394_9LAMI